MPLTCCSRRIRRTRCAPRATRRGAGSRAAGWRSQPSKLRPLQVGAELEHVLTAPQIARQAERLDPLQAGDLALLVVEEAAALRLRRVDHRRRGRRCSRRSRTAGPTASSRARCRAQIANRSTTPADQPLWLKSGVTSGGRNVFIVTCLTSRGNRISAAAEGVPGRDARCRRA